MFALGSAIGGLAGAAISPLYAVDPNMGLQFLIVSFLVVLLTGLTSLEANLAGLVIGAALVGGCTTILSGVMNPVWALVIVLAGVVAVIVARPRGVAS
jgi:branched-subunit amino acid ABC-type transport system permease component